MWEIIKRLFRSKNIANEVVDVFKLIDDRNRDLYNDVRQKINLEVSYTKNSFANCIIGVKNATIYISIKDPSVESFTHELLHIYFKLKGVNIVDYFKICVRESVDLQFLFDTELIEHICNAFLHKKMLPIYLSMGFSIEGFLADYNTYKCTKKQILSLKKNLSLLPKTKVEFFRLFVGKFFAMKCCPNEHFNYKVFYDELEKIDLTLFKDLSSIVDEWDGYQLDSRNEIIYAYSKIIDEIINSSKIWNRVN